MTNVKLTPSIKIVTPKKEKDCGCKKKKNIKVSVSPITSGLRKLR